MVKIVIFTGDGHCPQCDGLKARMESFGFKDRCGAPIEWRAATDEDIELYGLRSVPTMILMSASGNTIRNFRNPSDLNEVLETVNKIL